MDKSLNDQTHGGVPSNVEIADQEDHIRYAIHSLSARAAICNIQNYVRKINLNLRQKTIVSIFKNIDLTFEDGYGNVSAIENLFAIEKLLNVHVGHLFVDDDVDTIRCFLRLMHARGIPASLDYDDTLCGAHAFGHVTSVKFDEFEILENVCIDRYPSASCPGWDYSIDVSLAQLRLILSGDVETNPGPFFEKLATIRRVYSLRNDSVFCPFDEDKAKAFARSNFEDERDQEQWLCSNWLRYYPCCVCPFCGCEPPMDKLANDVVPVPDFIQNYFEKDLDFLASVFDGVPIDNFPAAIYLCDPMPDVLIITPASHLSTHKFAVRLDSDWYKFLLQYATFGKPGESLEIGVRAISSLPDHILEKILPQAHGLIDLALINVNADNLIQSLFGHIDIILRNSVVTGAKFTSRAFGILLQLCSVIANPDSISISSFLFNILESCAVTFTLMQKAVSILVPYFERLIEYCSLPCAQVDVPIDFGVVAQAAVMTCTTVVSLIVGSKLPEKGVIGSALRFAGTLGRSVNGITCMTTFLTTHLMSVFDWAYERVVGVPRDLSCLELFEKDVESYIRRVNKILKGYEDSMEQLRDKPDILKYILDTRTLGCNINEKLLRSKCSVQGMQVFNRYFNKLEKIVEKAELYGGYGAGPRPEPVVVQIFGASGCGKSHVPYFIAADLCVWEDADGSPVEHMYFRKTINEYFDGYKPGKHHMTVYDDFGQKRDSQANPNDEFMEVLYACNIAEWPLHMATLQEKACTYFNSKMILLTSNEINYNIQSMTHAEAFVRRVDLRYQISIDTKYKNSHGGIDTAKVKALHPNGDGVSEHVYRFVPYVRTAGSGNAAQFSPRLDPKSLQPLRYTYAEMIEELKIQYDNKQHHSYQRIQAMEKRFHDLKSAKDDTLFKDASSSVLPKAQVSLSQVEELLVCWYGRKGYPVDLYHDQLFSINVDKIDKFLEDSRDLWSFISLVVDSSIPIVCKARPGKEVDIDEIVAEVMKGGVVSTTAEMQAVDAITGSIRNYVKSFSKCVSDNIKFIVAIVTGALAVYKVYAWATGPKVMAAEHGVSGDVRTNAKPMIRVEHGVSGDVKTNARPMVRVEHGVSKPASEAYIDINVHEIISNVITTSTYRIGGKDAKFSANILFVRGQIALCNWHVWDFLSQFDYIKIANSDLICGYEMPYSAIECVKLVTRSGEFKDLVLLKFPRNVHQHKNVVHHFVRSQDISKFSQEQGILAGFTPVQDKLLYRVEPLAKITALDELKYTYRDLSGSSQCLSVRQAYVYNSQTGAGDCGSILLVNSPAIPRKICGIHSAGDKGFGYATSVTAEDLERALRVLSPDQVDFELPNCVDPEAPLAQCRDEMPQGEFVPLGISSVPAGSPGRSDIRPSPIYDSVVGHESVHLPAALKPIIVGSERVDPMKMGLAKCGVATKWIDSTTVDMAKSDFRSILFANTDPSYQKVLNYEESIVGTEDAFMNPMNRRSSGGFGWSQKAKGSLGKTKWLGDGEYILDDPELKTAVHEREKLARDGIRAPHLWVDTLKVERRPIEKVKAGKTRVFSVGQMDYCLLSRKYFLGFNGHVMSNRIDNEIAVGVNAYSAEWTHLAYHLQKKGDSVVAGDFSNYDGTLNPLIMHACLDLINEWYDDGEENALIRRTLFQEIVSSIHICGKLVYQWTHSQPSGNPLTTILNSMYNSLAARIIYINIFGEIKSFGKNVSMISYGDDNVLNISQDIISEYNQETMTKAYRGIGMIYTDESKGKNQVMQYRTLSEVEFLKRKFVWRGGRCDAPLSLETILEMVYWVRGDFDHDQLCISNCENAFEELCLHERATFDLWSVRIASACRARNLFPVLHSYVNFRNMLFLGTLGSSRGTLINAESDLTKNLTIMESKSNDQIHGGVPLMPEAQVLDSSNSPNMQPVTQLVEPADPIAKSDPQQVTQWVDDTAVQRASLPSPVVPKQDVIAPGLESREHNIVDILERPVKLQSFSWLDTKSFDDEIAAYDFPDSIITSAPNVADKIAHFTFLRAHIEVRFVVNANTFQAGRLVAYFAPFSTADEIGDRVSVNDYMSAKTVFPRVVLDAGSGNVGVLTIPYVSYFTHYDLARGLGDLGAVRISVLNKLQSGSATVSVFARFTNISLQIPTAVPNNLGTLSGLVVDFKKYVLGNAEAKNESFRSKLRQLIGLGMDTRVKRDLFDNYDLADSLPEAQVGEAELKASTGVVSTPLTTIGGMASMGTSLPVIGSYLTPISWIANAMASAASFFGLSKPTNLRPLDKLVSIPAYGFTNSDGIDNSLVLGTSVENEIGTRTDLFGSNLDEMDIPFICKHESFLVSFPWPDTAIPGTQIFKAAVSPGSMSYIMRSGNPVFNSTALGYVASMFKFWRGSLKYKIQVTKTAYHSGRLRISFVPSGGVDTTGYDFNQGYSEIVDLRTSDEIEFTIPYVSNTTWKPSYLDQFDSPVNAPAMTGVLIVEIINQLRRPDTVAASLDCNVWVSGGDDIQFAIPDFFQNVPVIDDTASLPFAQVLGQFQDTGFNQTMTNDNQMFSCPKTAPIDASATSIGEHIQNLRQLIKRFGVIGSAQLGSGTACKIQSNYFGEPSKVSSINTPTQMCPLDYVSWLYRFYRGGIRIKGQLTPAAFNNTYISLSNPGIIQTPAGPVLKNAQINAEYATFFNRAGTFRHYINTVYNHFIEVTAPYFSNTHISLLRGVGSKIGEFDDRSTAIFFGATDDEGGDGAVFMKAAADDFSFGWLVGPPKLQRAPPPGQTLTITPVNAVVSSTSTAGVVVLRSATATPLTNPIFDPQFDTTGGFAVGIVLYSTRDTVKVIYTDATFDEVPVIGLTLRQTVSSQEIVIPYDASKTINGQATLVNFRTYSTFTVVVPAGLT